MLISCGRRMLSLCQQKSKEAQHKKLSEEQQQQHYICTRAGAAGREKVEYGDDCASLNVTNADADEKVGRCLL